MLILASRIAPRLNDRWTRSYQIGTLNSSHKIRSLLVSGNVLMNADSLIATDPSPNEPNAPLSNYNLHGVTDIRSKYMAKLRQRNIFEADFQRTKPKIDGAILKESRESIIKSSKEFTESTIPISTLNLLSYLNHREIHTALRVSNDEAFFKELQKYASSRSYIKFICDSEHNSLVDMLQACLRDDMPHNLLLITTSEEECKIANQFGCVTCICNRNNSIISVDHKIESLESIQDIIEEYNGVSFR